MRLVKNGVLSGGRGAGWAILLATTALAGAHSALAAEANGPTTLQEVIVTAQKREENLQSVPVSIQALGSQKLEQLHVNGFNDYVKFLPSVAFQNVSPGFAHVYMRGVASGGDGNHSGSLPSVGVYLDEQPVTTIDGVLDVHIYDIARVEALAGPQGTLYGASSEAGTIRIITNQPSTAGFSAAYDLTANQVDHGGPGYVAEGYVNIPLSERAAIRLVGWDEHDGGYIDNVHATRTYPTSGVTIDNAPFVKSNYNTIDTQGARAALKINLDDNWTVTPTLMGQRQRSRGVFGYDPKFGDLKVAHFYPDNAKESWYQAALAVEGKISDFNLVYAGAYMDRRVKTQSDYTDYSFFYDTLFGSGAYVTDNAGRPVDPSQHIDAKDHFTKQSHELRISSPKEDRLRFVAGLFYQKQTHFIEQRYKIDALGSNFWVTGWPQTLWLTEQQREDEDYAVFGEASYDLTPRLTVTAGVRAYDSKNSLKGFYGFSANFSSKTGEAKCFAPVSVGAGPCTNLDKSVEADGTTYKINATYRLDERKLIYGTVSTGFRPGGVNRNGDLPPYQPDYLTNYEIGWKTSWLENSLRFNGAVFYEDWKDFQFSFLGPNSLTIIRNAGQARVIGVESDIAWQATRGLTLTGSGSYTDAELTQNYCRNPDPVTGGLITNCPNPAAPSGTELPVTPKVKVNGTARYVADLGPYRTHLQASVLYQGSSWADLRSPERDILGRLRAFTTVDLAAGVERDNWSVEFTIENAFDERGDIYRYSECTPTVCANPYIVPTKPRLFAVKFGQKF